MRFLIYAETFLKIYAETEYNNLCRVLCGTAFGTCLYALTVFGRYRACGSIVRDCVRDCVRDLPVCCCGKAKSHVAEKLHI